MVRREDRNDSGAVAIMVALLSVVLIGVLAFVADFGMAYANQRNLQNGVDAAVLAVGHEVALTAPGTADCNAMGVQALNSRTLAEDFFRRNAPDSGAALAAGVAGFNAACNANDQLVITAKAEQASPAFFGGIFGSDEVSIGEQARAMVGPAGTVVGLRPFAICQAMADLVKSNPGQLHTFDFDNANLGCGYSPGNWALLDFNGGNNATTEVSQWIQDGYSGPISVSPPVLIDGNPGAPNPGAFQTEMGLMMGDDIVLPVFDQFLPGQNGGNAQLRITGFVSVKGCAWKFNNKSGKDSICGDLTAVPTPIPANYLQIKFSKFVPIGELHLTCSLAAAGCDNGVRLSKLAD